jgi:MinD-like ATPase involved in chromosome partitioning or flagellar assembly
LAVNQFVTIVDHLSHLAKYTILDLGPSLSPVTDRVLEACDQLIVIVEPEPGSVTHTKALLDDLSLRVLGLDRINVAVVSRVRSELKLSRTQIQDQLGHAVPFVFTPVPELAFQATRAKIPLVLFKSKDLNTQQHNNLQQFKAMAQEIINYGQKISI